MPSLNTSPNQQEITARDYIDGNILHLIIEDGFIKQFDRERTEMSTEPLAFVAPGFIDNQVNGFASVDFGKKDLSLNDIRTATEALTSKGVTTFLPTLITNSYERLISSFKAWSQVLEDRELKFSIPGFHLEGPYISPEKGYRGAHQPEHIRRPDWDEFCRLNAAAQAKILQITVAPELPGALKFIQKCTESGIIVGIGHHHADRDTIRAAIDHGAKISTHLGNGCANMIHRHQNVLWPQLNADDLWASIIVDGYHNPPEVIRSFYNLKTSNRLILISDAVLFAGMPPGQYDWDGRAVDVKPEGIVMYAEGDSFAGSASGLDRGVGNIMRFTKCPLKEAIQMVSTNPARLLNLTDRGAIQIGKRADLVLFRYEKDALFIEKTIVAGKVVFKKN